MLPFRRVIAFSSRVHTYLLVLYLFFAIIYCFTLVFPAAQPLVDIVNLALTLIAWTLIFEGVWIALASVYQLFYSRVFAIAPIVLTALRIAACLAVGLVLDVLETLITRGGSF